MHGSGCLVLRVFLVLVVSIAVLVVSRLGLSTGSRATICIRWINRVSIDTIRFNSDLHAGWTHPNVLVLRHNLILGLAARVSQGCI